MSKTFNYTRAWHELALPMFNALPEPVKAGILEIAELVGDLNKDRNLDIPVPKAVETLTAVWTDEEMSKAAYAVYGLGHWEPGIKEVVTGGRFRERIPAPVSPIPTSKGEGRKVANVLDQILRKRLNLSRDNVMEGRLRVTCSTKNSWLWELVDWATRENLERIGKTQYFSESSYYAALQRIQPVNLTASFMEHEEGTEYTTEEQVEALQAAGITIDRRSCQKFDPHVPVVGRKAMAHSTSGYIDGSAPCDHPGCTLRMDKHTSKYFLYVSDPDKAREVLTACKISLDKYTIELPPPEERQAQA